LILATARGAGLGLPTPQSLLLDWVSRAVLAWRLSNTLDADFCVEALEEALSRYGRPDIFNTDQAASSPVPILPAP
jgi:transposase InsO family protein